MKKVVSIILALLLFALALPLNVGAVQPPFSQSFESKEAMLSALLEYTQAFPNVPYADSALVRPKNCVATNKKVVLPTLKDTYATEYEYSFAESQFGRGVDYTFTSYKTVESDSYIRFLTYYSVPEFFVPRKVERMYFDHQTAKVYSGEVCGYSYSAANLTDEETTYCEYRFAVEDKYIICYTEDEYCQEFVDNLQFEETDASLSLYVSGEKYYDKVVERFYGYEPDAYEEMYFHFSDENNAEPDWVLIKCQILPPPWMAVLGVRIGDRVLSTLAGCSFCGKGFCVYIREIDDVLPLVEKNLEQIYELCPGFVEIIDENNLGRLYGDIDNNGCLDVVDATYIQRHLVGYKDGIFEEPYKYDIYLYDNYAICDVDYDNQITIVDATIVQRKVAGLE